ncbi:MAG: thioredoxin domain-containing protein [Trueperaceae bacterium]|nr:thioredoxin domain-containing protein [Trueperaceae bacterium]
MTPQRLTLITIVVAVLVVAGILIAPRLGGGEAADLDVSGQPVLGQADAPVTVTVFEDFRCPGCQAFELNVMPGIRRDHVEAGEVRVVYMNLPVLGPESEYVARIGECVYRQSNEAFWEMKAPLYRAQGELANGRRAVELALTYAPGIDAGALDACLAEPSSLEDVRADAATAAALGLRSTPSVLVDGVLVSSPSEAVVRAAIDAALAD